MQDRVLFEPGTHVYFIYENKIQTGIIENAYFETMCSRDKGRAFFAEYTIWCDNGVIIKRGLRDVFLTKEDLINSLQEIISKLNNNQQNNQNNNEN